MARRALIGEAARGELPESLPVANMKREGKVVTNWLEAERSRPWQALFRPQHRTCKVSATLVKGTPALISRQGPLTRKFTWTQWQKYPNQPEVFPAEKWCIACTTAARRPPPREWRQPWSLHGKGCFGGWGCLLPSAGWLNGFFIISPTLGMPCSATDLATQKSHGKSNTARRQGMPGCKATQPSGQLAVPVLCEQHWFHCPKSSDVGHAVLQSSSSEHCMQDPSCRWGSVDSSEAVHTGLECRQHGWGENTPSIVDTPLVTLEMGDGPLESLHSGGKGTPSVTHRLLHGCDDHAYIVLGEEVMVSGMRNATQDERRDMHARPMMVEDSRRLWTIAMPRPWPPLPSQFIKIVVRIKVTSSRRPSWGLEPHWSRAHCWRLTGPKLRLRLLGHRLDLGGHLGHRRSNLFNGKVRHTNHHGCVRGSTGRRASTLARSALLPYKGSGLDAKDLLLKLRKQRHSIKTDASLIDLKKGAFLHGLKHWCCEGLRNFLPSHHLVVDKQRAKAEVQHMLKHGWLLQLGTKIPPGHLVPFELRGV